MILCEVCLLACAAALCIQSIWTDLRAGQIKNKYLLFWLAASILLNGVYYTCYARASFQAAAWNLVLSALVSVGFYAIHIWSAGDSKLIVVLLSLLPGRLCWDGAETVFPAAYLFLALFSIGYLYLIGEALWLDFRSHAVRWPFLSQAAVCQTVREYLRVWAILYALDLERHPAGTNFADGPDPGAGAGDDVGHLDCREVCVPGDSHRPGQSGNDSQPVHPGFAAAFQSEGPAQREF